MRFVIGLALLLSLGAAIPKVIQERDPSETASRKRSLDELKNDVNVAYSKLQNEGLKDIISLGEKMEKSNLLGKDKIGIKEKLAALKSKAGEKMKPIDIQGTSEKLSGKLDTLSTGITAVSSGFGSMKQAFESGNWLDFAVAGLDMASSLSSLAGPMGAVVGQVLGMFSMILGLFQDSPKEETQEEMMRRVIKEELESFREEDLLARGNGFIRAFSILSKSIQHFRDKDAEISNDIASELFNKAFDGLEIYGELESYMDTWCTSTMADIDKYRETFKNRGEYGSPKWTEWTNAKEVVVNAATRCLKLVNVYSQLSIMRQLMLVNMASLLSTSNCKVCQKLQTNLLYTVKAEQDVDRSILNYFADPVREWRRRFAVSYYFSNPENYPIIKAYLNKLDESVQGDMYGDGILICSEKELLADCLKLRFSDKTNQGDGSVKNMNLHGWNNIRSVFVPRGYRLYNGNPDTSTQTITGPNMINVDETWKSIHMERTTSDIAAVRLCSSAHLAASSSCLIIPEGVTNLNVKGKVSSMAIPAGLQVTGRGAGKEWGPFIGPQIIQGACEKEKWETIDVTGTPMRSTNMIKICKREMFRDDCEYVSESTTLQKLHGCEDTFWRSPVGGNKYKMRFKSIEIPSGVQVLLYTNNDFTGKLLGNYIGPLKVKDVDSYPNYGSMKVVSLVGDDGDTNKVPFS